MTSTLPVQADKPLQIRPSIVEEGNVDSRRTPIVFLYSLIAAFVLAAVAAGVIWRVRSRRPVIYPELTRPLSTTPGRHKLVK